MSPPPSRAVFAALAVFSLASLADGVLMPFFAVWAEHVAGVPAALTGVLLACYAGGELVATPFLGGIADRAGRRPVLLASTAGVGAGFLLLAAAPNGWVAAPALLLVGVFESVLHPTASAVLADCAGPGGYRPLFARARAGSALGQVAGPLAGAALAQHSLALVFAGAGAALLLAFLLVVVLLPETRTGRTGATDDEDDDDLTALGAMFRDRALAGLLLPVAGTMIASSWIESVLPLFAVDHGLLDPAGVGVLFGCAAALAAALQLPVSKWSDAWGVGPAVLASGVALTGAFAAMLALPGLAGPVAAVVLEAAASVFAGPVVPSLVAERAPVHARATYLAALSSVNDVRDAAGPAVGTLLYAAGSVLPWAAGLPLAGFAALHLARAARQGSARPGQTS